MLSELPDVPPGHVRVYRMEAPYCGINPYHGPMMMCACGSYAATPFGGRGRGPSHIEPHESCGVTKEQAPYWWSTPRPEQAKSMMFGVYDVPAEELREDAGQVVFVARREYRVGELSPSEVHAWNYDHPVDITEWHRARYRVVRSGHELVAA